MQRLLDLGDAFARHREVHDVALLDDGVARGQLADAEPGDARDAGAGGLLDRAVALADPGRADVELGEAYPAVRFAPLFLLPSLLQSASLLACRPLHRRDALVPTC